MLPLKLSGRYLLSKSMPVSSVALSSSLSSSLSSLSSAKIPQQDAFTELEHKNWQRGVDAYTAGFGPLTSQAVPTLLERAGFLPTTTAADIDNDNNGCSQNGGVINRTSSLLDLACGPGQVVTAAVSKAKASTTINDNDNADNSCCCSYTALDFSSNFLQLAERNLKSDHPDIADTDINFVEGDAQAMASLFDDESFTSVTSNFGILHLSSPDSFLLESYRVLKPGGKLAFSAWSAPPNTEGFDLILGAVKDAGNPNVALPEGPPFFRFSNPEEIQRSLEAAGFIDIDVTVVDTMQWTNVDSSDQLYDILLEGTARTRELLRGQTEEETKAVKEELKRRYGERVTEGDSARRHLRMPAVISSGRKPL